MLRSGDVSIGRVSRGQPRVERALHDDIAGLNLERLVMHRVIEDSQPFAPLEADENPGRGRDLRGNDALPQQAVQLKWLALGGGDLRRPIDDRATPVLQLPPALDEKASGRVEVKLDFPGADANLRQRCVQKEPEVEFGGDAIHTTIASDWPQFQR